MLSISGLGIVSLSAMGESGVLGIEAVEAVGLLVYEIVILRDELPANFRRVDWTRRWRGFLGNGRWHYHWLRESQRC